MASANSRAPPELSALPELSTLEEFSLGSGLDSRMPWMPAPSTAVGGMQGAPASGPGFAASDALLDFLHRSGTGGMASERAFDAFASGSTGPVAPGYPAPSPFLVGQNGSQHTGTSTMSSAMTDETWDDSVRGLGFVGER